MANALEDNENLGAVALAYWRKVLRDGEASDTAKDSAAKGLAAYDRQQKQALAGSIIKMTRSEITNEINRVKALLG